MRAVMNGVMYILSTGCQWRYLPKDFPPRSTVHNYFIWWQCDDVLDRIHHALYVECRERAEREASPTACIIDSQSVKSAEKGGACIDPHGFDAGKLIKGKKRAYSRRYAGSVAARHRSFRRHSGSRRRHRVAGDAVWSVPISAKAVCGQRLSRADLRQRAR